MTVSALLRIARNVADLQTATAFYVNALGFQLASDTGDDAALAARLGIRRARTVRLRLGGQEIELSQCEPAGAAYPAAAANDLCFQHFAMVTPNIAASLRLAVLHGGLPISSGGPQRLPVSSGGVTAWKFRDPDGHPLEFLEFPGVFAGGARIDHTAISVADVDRSVAFYQTLGLQVVQRTLNRGTAQDVLDGLAGAIADVVSLRPRQAAPHVELLHYRAPARDVSVALRPEDIAADRMVFASADGKAGLQRDPDGHFFVQEAAAMLL